MEIGCDAWGSKDRSQRGLSELWHMQWFGHKRCLCAACGIDRRGGFSTDKICQEIREGKEALECRDGIWPEPEMEMWRCGDNGEDGDWDEHDLRVGISTR